MSALLSIHGLPYWRSSKNDTERITSRLFSQSETTQPAPFPLQNQILMYRKEDRDLMLLLTLECLNCFKIIKKVNFFLLNTCSSERTKKKKYPRSKLIMQRKFPFIFVCTFVGSLLGILEARFPLQIASICG